MRRAQFEIVSSDAEKITLRDLGPWTTYLTVTNDAERVVQEIRPFLMKGDGTFRRLRYYDSEGELIEIVLTDDGKFRGFG